MSEFWTYLTSGKSELQRASCGNLIRLSST